MSHDDDQAWLDAQVPKLDALDPLVRQTIAGAREQGSRRHPTPLWPVFGLLATGAVAVFMMTRVPEPHVVALVVEERPAAAQEIELFDDEDDSVDLPGMADVDVDELTDDEVAAISEELKDWPRS